MNLNQVTIQSKNLILSVDFYLKLGLELIVDSRPRYVRFSCSHGESTFSISHSKSPKANTNTLYFEVFKIDKTFKNLTQKGIETNNSPKDKSWLWREFDLSDPDGHRLKIYTAGKNRKNPPWRIKQKRWFDAFIESPFNLMK